MILRPSPTVLDAVLRRDFTSFYRKAFNELNAGRKYVECWHTSAICELLGKVASGDVKRAVINLPPRYGKSLLSSVALPAYMLGHDPRKRFICVSHSAELAKKHGNDCRAVVRSRWYRDIFPNTRVSPQKDTEVEFTTTMGGGRYATSIDGTLTGRGGDVFIIDDPLKAADADSDSRRSAVNEWFCSTAQSRLDNKREGAIVIVMQRLHMEDLAGFVLQEPEEWTVLSLPATAEIDETIPLSHGRSYQRRVGEALAPELEPLQNLEAIRRRVGSAIFAAQYQQQPLPPGGAMIKRHWIKYYDALPVASTPFILQSWDTAMKGGPDNDWSVCTTWYVYGADAYLVDVWRERVGYPVLKATVADHAARWKVDQVLIEESGTAIGLLQELGSRVSGLTGVKVDRDKPTRMSIASAKFEAGQVYFPTNAPWLAELERELFAFPGGRHDDQVDSISQALNRMPEIFNHDAFLQNLQGYIRDAGLSR